MFSKAARRPARPDRTPRRTRATAPAHSKPSCKGAFFLEFDSFIRQNSHKEKRDPDRRSTLRHSLGPKGTRIPSSTAVLASDNNRPARYQPARINSRQDGDIDSPCHHPFTNKTAIKNDRPESFLKSPAKSSSHRTTRRFSLISDIFGDFATRTIRAERLAVKRFRPDPSKDPARRPTEL